MAIVERRLHYMRNTAYDLRLFLRLLLFLNNNVGLDNKIFQYLDTGE